ncbi:ADAMTS-like protein 5 isoform X2 [Coturnix japonica]|uniref:ADAMTS-like protein 5 isoform X2 n=1 Tax=Coturnix japonica TaxID=93934 RepID=UPI00077701FA|nr:ADAMTS-like protein 5 isoform X2 [Coturnix japonica]
MGPGMAVIGRRDGLAPRAHPRGTHGAGCWWPWWALLLAWFILGINTMQVPAPRGAMWGPEPPTRTRPRRQPTQGVWGPWGPWSACSSSCGDGVALRTRRCLRSAEEEPCTGDQRQYRLCQLQGCPGGSVPFRAMQCSLYDDKPVQGMQTRHRWVPFYGAPNVCDLNCLAVGHNFYYTFGRVLDGTRCRPGSTDLCVGGRCMSIGCDGILAVGTQLRGCSRCGAGQDGCLFVHRLFQDTEPFSGHFGYMNVTKIPAGATNIKVTDKSRNFLALMRSDGRYVLNGDWSIAWPGPYEAAGTQLLYARSPDGTESLEAPGPTDEDLHVLEPNPGIEYEFWLPRQHPQGSMVDTSALRQPQPRGAGSPPPAEPPLPTVPPRSRGPIMEPPPPRSPTGVRAAAGDLLHHPTPPDYVLQRGRCGRCHPPKGRSQRIQHFCQSDFVFRARILAQRSVGQEMRYEVQVVTLYRHRFPMVPLEYVWVPDTCGCPILLGGHDYVLMARRHVNYEHTLNRILLQRDGYARPWSPREERAVRDAGRRCAHQH